MLDRCIVTEDRRLIEGMEIPHNGTRIPGLKEGIWNQNTAGDSLRRNDARNFHPFRFALNPSRLSQHQSLDKVDGCNIAASTSNRL